MNLHNPKRIEKVEAAIFGSPIYSATISGEMKSFMERWMFIYLYIPCPPSISQKNKYRVYLHNEYQLKSN
jgi:multimeric flavodoxin WrbA